MKKFFGFLCLIILCLVINTKSAYSGDLGALIRLDRLTASQSTGGLVCATPESAGTESSLQIIFPSGMSVNTTSSNWTVNTSNILQGSTAMPGIGTATSVSGQTVTFPISDLSVGTQYCFNFSSSSTLTTPSTVGNYEGTMRTRNSSNTTIDTRTFSIPIVSSNSINVTATVPADPTDFSAELTLTDPTTNRIREDTTITYRLTYGSNLSYVSDIVVEADWDYGTIRDSGASNTEEVVDYVTGSATNGYNNTTPVIDLVNKKIVWTISSFPGNTTKSVQFQLRTYHDYRGSQPVDFTVAGRVTGIEATTPDSEVDSSYQYSPYITLTPTPTCVPSRCPTPIPSATPTPTPVPDQTEISNIDISSITAENVEFNITSNNETTVKVIYGTSPSNLNQTLSFPAFSKSHNIVLNDLFKKTRYFFKVILTDKYKRVTNSDVYVVDTASGAPAAIAKLDTLIITSDDVVLTDPLRNSDRIPRIVLPKKTHFAFKFAVANYENIKTIKAFIRDNKVLGLSSNVAYAATTNLTITEISPGQYIGRLNTSPVGGNYELALQISDYSGNITEQIAGVIKVTDSLRVIDALTKKGLENARVTLFYYNQRTKTYELLSQALTPIKNPTSTDPEGASPIVLPAGKYRAEIESLGFEKKSVEFTISPDDTNYPQIEMRALPPDAGVYFKYMSSNLMDLAEIFQTFLHSIRVSNRFFDLTAFIGFLIMTMLLTVSASRRMSVPIRHLPYFLIYHFRALLKRPIDTYIVHGKVTIQNAMDNVISGALIYISLPNGKVLTHTRTNIDGEFFAKIDIKTDLSLLISKKGFQTQKLLIKKADLNDNQKIGLIPRKMPSKFSFSSILWYISFFTGSLFETILILTLIIEILFLAEFGIFKVGPFMLITLFNILLWGFHVRHTKSA